MSQAITQMLFFFFCLCSDKMFPAFGFGAQIPPNWQVKYLASFGNWTVLISHVTDFHWCFIAGEP